MISEFSFQIPMINYGNKAVGDLITIFSALLYPINKYTLHTWNVFVHGVQFLLINTEVAVRDLLLVLAGSHQLPCEC